MNAREVNRTADPRWIASVTVSSHLFLDARRLIDHRVITDESSPTNRGQQRRRFLVLHLLVGERSGRVALRISRVSRAEDIALLASRAAGGAQWPLTREGFRHDLVLKGRPLGGIVASPALLRRHPSLIRKCRAIGLAIESSESDGVAATTESVFRTVERTILELSYDLGPFTPSRLMDFSDIVGETVSLRRDPIALRAESRAHDALRRGMK